jgi:hypothetical protein
VNPIYTKPILLKFGFQAVTTTFNNLGCMAHRARVCVAVRDRPPDQGVLHPAEADVERSRHRPERPERSGDLAEALQLIGAEVELDGSGRVQDGLRT